MTEEMPRDRKFDPIYLFIRTDEKYEEVRAEMHDMKLALKDTINTLERVEKRIDFGVAVTGNKNSDELKLHAVEIDRLKRSYELEQQKLTNVEKTLLNEIGEIKKWLIPIYKGIVAIFFTLVAGGAIIYFLKFFKFNIG